MTSSRTKCAALVLGGAITGLAGASASRGELTYDLRVADGGKAVQVDRVGQVVRLELYAIVQGQNGRDDETLYNACITLSSADARLADSLRGDFASMELAPRYRQTSASGGTPVDVDGDGDLDLGRLGGDLTYIFARGFVPGGPDPVGTRVVYRGNVDAEEFLLGTVNFTVTSSGVPTALRPVRPDSGLNPRGLYVEDGRNVTEWSFLPSIQTTDAITAPVLVSVVPEATLAGPVCFLIVAHFARRRRTR